MERRGGGREREREGARWEGKGREGKGREVGEKGGRREGGGGRWVCR